MREIAATEQPFWGPWLSLEAAPVGALVYHWQDGELPETIREAVRKELQCRLEDLEHWARLADLELASNARKRAAG